MQDPQIATQQFECLAIACTAGILNGLPENDDPNDMGCTHIIGGTKFKVCITKSSDYAMDEVAYEQTFSYSSAHKSDHPKSIPPSDALDFLAHLVNEDVSKYRLICPETTFHCFTEHNHFGQIYHSHPDYHWMGPWYDWAYVRFGFNNDPDGVIGSINESYPAQIWFFVDLRKLIHLIKLDEEGDKDGEVDLCTCFPGFVAEDDDLAYGLYAVVTPMAKLPSTLAIMNTTRKGCNHHAKSLLLKAGMRDNKLWLVAVNAFWGPAMVIDNMGHATDHKESLMVVTPRSEWADKFQALADLECSL